MCVVEAAGPAVESRLLLPCVAGVCAAAVFFLAVLSKTFVPAFVRSAMLAASSLISVLLAVLPVTLVTRTLLLHTDTFLKSAVMA